MDDLEILEELYFDSKAQCTGARVELHSSRDGLIEAKDFSYPKSSESVWKYQDILLKEYGLENFGKREQMTKRGGSSETYFIDRYIIKCRPIEVPKIY